jgi:hypothetical protein
MLSAAHFHELTALLPVVLLHEVVLGAADLRHPGGEARRHAGRRHRAGEAEVASHAFASARQDMIHLFTGECLKNSNRNKHG